jgi:prepilin peptidase CpaA
MALTSWTAIWFLPLALPLCFLTAYSDLARMRIPNLVVGALVAWFALIGPVALPFDQYLVHWVQVGVMLLVGMALFAAGVFGAGDAKFVAAAAGYVALGDLALVMALFAACLLGALVTHRLARASRLRAMTPHWASWTATRHFPMGLPLAGTLVIYLALAAIGL